MAFLLLANNRQKGEIGNDGMYEIRHRTVKFEQKFLRPNAIENRSNVPQPETPGKMCSNKEMLRDSEDSIPL